MTDVDSDQQQGGLEVDLSIDRDTASRFGLSLAGIDNTLYDAFGQRQVSTIYNPLNQYHVVMEVAPQYWQSPETLQQLFVSTSGGAVSGTSSSNAVVGTVVASTNPNATTVASITTDTARNQASKQPGQYRPWQRLDRGGGQHDRRNHGAACRLQPLRAGHDADPGQSPGPFRRRHHLVQPAARHIARRCDGGDLSDHERDPCAGLDPGGLSPAPAALFQSSLANEPVLIVAALLAVYIVLGVLYESYIHPITILSTLPSAGVGAILALLACDTEFSIIAMIGVILLIGIVKKNAIMMIDFALDAERNQGMNSRDAIFEAALKRFRPILMTTMAAALGALPLAVGAGDGAEFRGRLEFRSWEGYWSARC